MLQATDAGLQAVGAAAEDDPGPRAPVQAKAAQNPAPVPTATSARLSAKLGAHSVLAAWDDPAEGRPALPDDNRPGFQAALAQCRQFGAVLAAARLDRITRRAHTPSQLLEDGYSVRAADMPGADHLMMRSTRRWHRRSGN